MTSAARLFLVTLLSIFAAEALTMLLLARLQDPGTLTAAFLDAFILVLLMFPVSYFTVLKPLERQIARTRRAEREKDRLIVQLRKAGEEIKVLHGIIPICSHCRRIRSADGSWENLDSFVRENTEADFSHTLCPECSHWMYRLPMINE